MTEEVLGPLGEWQALNVFTSAVIAILVVLSLVLTAGVLFPDMGAKAILGILSAGAAGVCCKRRRLRLLSTISACSAARGADGSFDGVTPGGCRRLHCCGAKALCRQPYRPDRPADLPADRDDSCHRQSRPAGARPLR